MPDFLIMQISFSPSPMARVSEIGTLKCLQICVKAWVLQYSWLHMLLSCERKKEGIFTSPVQILFEMIGNTIITIGHDANNETIFFK